MSTPSEPSSGKTKSPTRTRLETLFLLSIVAMVVVVASLIVREMSRPSAPIYVPPPVRETRPMPPATEPATTRSAIE